LVALPTSDVKNYLDKWIAKKHDGASAEDVLKMLSELAREIDEEYAAVSLESEEKLRPEFEAREGDEVSFIAVEKINKKTNQLGWTALGSGIADIVDLDQYRQQG
jgi:hypothetical protein